MTGELLSNARALGALLLLGLSLPCLAHAYARAVRVWAPAGASARRGLAGATAAAAVMRWFVAPKWIVTMYIGYLLTAQAIDLSAASHYGMGSLALYHALFAILPHDHRYLIWTNAVVGVLTLPLAATFVARLLRSPRAGVVFAAFVAFTPLFIKNDDSDANHVPCLLWMFGGLVAWDDWLDDGGRPALAAAVPLFALAATARPEMPVLLPVLLALLTLGLAPPLARLRDPALFVGALLAALVVAPHVAHVIHATAQLEARDSLPGAGSGGLRRALLSILDEDAVLTPSLYPLGLLVLAAVGLAAPRAEPEDGSREPPFARVALALASLVALATYGLDLCRANMARVHVPGALFVTMLAARGAVVVWARLRHPAARAAIPVAVAASAVPTAFTLWAPTNEQAEEDFLREALRALPREPYTLVRMDRADRNAASPGSAFTHHHFPDYLVRANGSHVASIRDFSSEPDFERPSFFYQGTRCYAEFRDAGVPAPHGDGLQPACRALREAFTLVPVLERVVKNRGDVWLEYYGDAPELRLGLYRIEPKAPVR
jgi:hypothetical protein